MKHSKHILQHNSFSYNVIDFDAKTKEYVLEHQVTKSIKRIPEADFKALYAEQHNKDTDKKYS